VTAHAVDGHRFWTPAIGWVRHNPGTALAWILALHFLIWTFLPLVSSHNLQLDLVEDLALGKEWQVGYWKHPPLPWWIADAAYRLSGDVRVVYVLGPLSVVVSVWAVWRLASMVIAPTHALIAALALEGTHFYNYSSVKFAHDQCQLPFWALTGLFLYRAITTQRVLDWILSGAFLALAFWSKYAAIVLAGTIALIFLCDPTARKSLRTAGPYFMTMSFAVCVAPQVWWLVTTGFMPFHYVDLRAIKATHWYHYLDFPLRWAVGQVFFVAPTLALIAFVTWPPSLLPRLHGDQGFPRRYVTAIAFGPFVLTTLIALWTGRLPVAMWGYPLWSFLPLALLLWFSPHIETSPRRLTWFAMAFMGIFLAFPLAYAASTYAEPLIRDRPQAAQFAGRLLAETTTRAFRERTHGALVYVTGTEFAANNVVVYSEDRPHVIVHRDLRLSPWIDPAELARHGAIIVLEPELISPEDRNEILRLFPGAEFQPPLFLPRATLVPRRQIKIEWAIVPPRM
jgi:hypothetical protein